MRARYGKNPEGTANSLWSQDSSSRVNDQNPSIGPDQDYSFVGMAHIFDQHVDSGDGYKNFFIHIGLAEYFYYPKKL